MLVEVALGELVADVELVEVALDMGLAAGRRVDRRCARRRRELPTSSNAIPTVPLLRAGPYFGPYFSVAP